MADEITQEQANPEQPRIRWQVVGLVAGGLAIAWLITSSVAQSYGAWWPYLIPAALTLIVGGFGIYITLLMRKSSKLMDIMRRAQDPEGRKAALAELASGDSKDAMNAVARAQLHAQDGDHNAAIEVLEAIDIDKAPTMVQDDVRAQLGLLYLATGKIQKARSLSDEIRLDRQPNAEAKSMYAAVVAESFARTGNAAEAKKLMETYKASDPAYGKTRPLLLRAQVFTFTATKNRGLAKKAMEELAAIDPNQLAAFVAGKGVPPELRDAARGVLTGMGAIPKQRMKMR